ncbi:MAG: hypothetical protein AB8F95_14885 [Bacteroidia bacterium]
MKSNHPTDEFVRRKLADQVPELNEAHWEEALAMLETGAEVNRFAWLRHWWAIGLLMLISVGGLSFYALSDLGEEAAVIAETGSEDLLNATKTQANLSIEEQGSSSESNAESNSEAQANLRIEDQGSSSEVVTGAKIEDQGSNSESNTGSNSEAQANLSIKDQGSSSENYAGSNSEARANLRIEDQGANSKNEVFITAFKTPVFGPNPSNVKLPNSELGSNTPARVASFQNVAPIPATNIPVEHNFDFPQAEVKIVPIISSKVLHHHVGISTGLGLARGLGDPTATGLAPSMGLHYSFTPKKRWALEANLLYTMRNGLSGGREFQSTYYGFGRSTEHTLLTFTQRHMIEAPVNVVWKIAHRHRLLLGASLARQVNVQGELLTVTTDPFGKQTSATVREGGYRQAYSSYDLSLQAGYGIYLGRGIRIDAIGQYGLTDQTPQSFWGSDIKDRNAQIRLQLTYNFVHW